MKIKIKTYNGELPSYLTVGKVYDAQLIDIDNNTYFIVSDIGSSIVVDLDYSANLNGGSWEVVE